MMKNSRLLAPILKLSVLSSLPMCLALLAAGCGYSSNGSSGTESSSPSSGGATGGGASLGGAPSASASSSSGGGGSSSVASSSRGGNSDTGGSETRASSSRNTGGSTRASSSEASTSSTGGDRGGNSTAGGAGAGGQSSTGEAGRGGSTRPVTTGGTASAGSTGSSAGGSTGAAGSTGSSGSGTPVKSVGCGKTSTVQFATVPGESGTNVGTGKGGYVTVNGRGFAMRLPDNYDNNTPYWLIFGFHWNGGTSKDVDTGGSNGYSMAHFGLQALSKNGAIFVAPQGNGNGWGGNNLPFVDDMVKLIKENYCVDETRLYANGFSYGGGMSYAIACARAKVFRAVAIYNGAILSGCEGGNDPIAYWQMAGTTDGTCTIDGHGKPMRDRFVKNNGCTGPTTEPPRPSGISQPHICTDYTGCKAGYPLRWCAHPAGHGNAIVDGTGDLYNTCATPPKTCSDSCKCTWVPADVWKFFTSL